jgi:hypothetical protein
VPCRENPPAGPCFALAGIQALFLTCHRQVAVYPYLQSVFEEVKPHLRYTPTGVIQPHGKRSSAEHRGANSMGVKHINWLHLEIQMKSKSLINK